MTRLLGRIGWPIVFFLVAGLVFAGLGWVTYAAIGVEQAQREAAARAELGNNLRVALWRLDGRMLPAFGVEDSRPFYHYDSADPAGAFGAAATPLLAANLPDWMRLHFQLDPASGWASNQAPTDRDEADRVRAMWPDLPNFYGGREVVLADLKAKLPVRTTCDLFAARDRAIPADSLPFAAPLFTEVNPVTPAEPNPAPNPTPQPPESAPKPPPPADPTTGISSKTADPNADTVRVFGFEFCRRSLDQQQQDINQLAANQLRNDVENSQKKTGEQGKAAAALRATSPSQTNIKEGMRVAQKVAESEPGWIEYLKRAQSAGKGLQEAKGIGAYDSRFPLPRNQSQGNYSQNSPDQKNAGGFGPAQQPGPPVGAKNDVLPLVVPGSGGAAPVAPLALPAGGKPTVPGLPPMEPGGDKSKEKSAKDSASPKPGGVAEADLAKKLEANADETAAFGWLLRSRDANRKTQVPELPDADGKAAAKPLAPAVPGEDRPPQPPAAVALPAPMAVHVGSLRPQWVTGPDGTEVLLLVRAARLEFKNLADNKTVYQGIVIDWQKLEAKLKEEVKDLFPDARLVAVRDPEGVSPDRAMTALPVQLDPGPEPALPPAGWTPLRIGLVLAWAAAIIAVVAVGFSGWSLIDLAERRIRFVSAVTHELRTPLTSLRLYLDLLVSGMIQDEAKRQEYLNTLATESDRLHRLVDNVLDFAKLEKRRKNGDIKPIEVCELLDQIRSTWTDRVAQDGKELLVISTLPPEREVATDPAMIQQIIGNLIDNARKYTRDADDKRIWLWAKPGPGNAVLLEVEDRGSGVPANERRSIFKPFRRGEQADSKAGGAGLGLALAKSWAEVLGAKLTYRPADGGTGACFRVELPGK